MHALETSKLLTEEYSAKILLALMGRPKSALELSDKLDIPIAACYRKINLLESAGLICCEERKLTLQMRLVTSRRNVFYLPGKHDVSERANRVRSRQDQW